MEKHKEIDFILGQAMMIMGAILLSIGSAYCAWVVGRGLIENSVIFIDALGLMIMLGSMSGICYIVYRKKKVANG